MCCFPDSRNNFYSVQKFWKINNNINKRRKCNDLKTSTFFVTAIILL